MKKNSAKNVNATTTIEAAILEELRIVFAELAGDDTTITDESMTEAVTLNANMESLGYRLKPSDIVLMAKAGASAMSAFWTKFQNIIPSVDAEPMYPGFPQQVLEMSEAEYRWHQLLHYLTTYGVMDEEGCYSRGWLPHQFDTTDEDEEKVYGPALIPAKVIELRDIDELYTAPVAAILTKKERLNASSKELIRQALPHVTVEQLSGLHIPFKENIAEVFTIVMGEESMMPQEKAEMIHTICQHTGDVWRCVSHYLGNKRYKLSTSERRAIVQSMELFPVGDFRANLVLSSRRKEDVLKMLEYISYNRFSRSSEHRQAVADLRGSKLKSWHSLCEYLIAGKDEARALAFIGQRPGILLRMVKSLVKKGFDPKAVQAALCEHAEDLSGRTLVSILTAFGRPDVSKWTENEREAVSSIVLAALKAKLAEISTPLNGCKVAFAPEAELYALDKSEFTKAEEGGYVRPGMAFNIPDGVKYLRFFTYWNDERNYIDVDLHANCVDVDGNAIDIGWNASYKAKGIAVTSGDITHSDAAEYIDLNLEAKQLDRANLRIRCYTGIPFAQIDTVLCGVMAVGDLGENVELYDPKNCIVSHNLRSKEKDVDYGYIDVKSRLFVLRTAQNSSSIWDASEPEHEFNEFTIGRYVDELLSAQQCIVVDNEADADIVVRVGKPQADGEISLIDNSWFLDL